MTHDSFPSTAFLGLGAMGRRMAARLLDAGIPLTVWNRTPSRADALRSRGARVAASPAEAAEQAAVTFVMVAGDEASEAVWSGPGGLMGALSPGSIAVECSTLSVRRVAALEQQAARGGCRLIEAPVSGSLPQAETGALTFLLGGRQDDIAEIANLLAVLGRVRHYVGALQSAARVKLAVNGLLALQVCSTAEILGFLSRTGVTAGEVERFVEGTPVLSPIVAATLRQIATGNFEPLYPISLVLKDLGYLADEAGCAGADLPLTSATHETFKNVDAWRQQNISAVARQFLTI